MISKRCICVSTDKKNDVWEIKGLAASEPDPKLKDKLMLFGQFIGGWDIKARYIQPDGIWVNMRGEVHFRWILNGTAIQDVWLGRREDSKDMVVFGTTVRFYDPKIDAWRSTWISPLKGLVQLFIGRKINDEIVLELQNTNGYPENWIFSEITNKSFRWRAEETHDKGKTWLLTEEMHMKRI